MPAPLSCLRFSRCFFAAVMVVTGEKFPMPPSKAGTRPDIFVLGPYQPGTRVSERRFNVQPQLIPKASAFIRRLEWR